MIRTNPDNNSSAPAPGAVRILGVSVVPFASYAQAVACVAESLTDGRKSFWVAVNPQKVYQASRDARLRSVIDRADVGICDGVGVSAAVKLLHGQAIARCTGCDLFFELLAAAAQKDWKVFILGAKPETNNLACQKLRRRYPGLQIVGRHDGYFQDSPAVVRKINDSQADLLFVAMGSPRQEFWISEHRQDISAKFCMGIGGSLDVASGVVKRAPGLLRKMGLEFAYQAIREPHRLRRQVAYVPYTLMVLREKLLRSRRAPGDTPASVDKPTTDSPRHETTSIAAGDNSNDNR